MIKIGSSKIVLLTIFALMVLISYPVNTQANQDPLCPTGYVCTPISAPSVPVACPAGFTCVPTVVNNSSSYNPSPSTSPTVLSCSLITTNLKIGDISNDVSLLHDFLIAKGYSFPGINSGANPKNYFGIETLGAVMKYQKSIGVSDTGFVGPMTRAVINGSCNNNAGSVNNQSVIKVINPSSGIVDFGGQFKVQWTGYSGDFDYYQITLGNSVANVEVSLDENTKISKYQNSYSSFVVWYFVKQITDKSGLAADKIKDAYYIKVNAVKADVAGGGIVSTGKSSLFSIGSTTQTSSSSGVSGIKVLSPNGGESLIKGATAKIQWNYSPLPPSNFAINLQRADRMENVGQIRFCDSSTYYQDNYPNANRFWFNWRVGYDAQGKEIPDGNYRVMVYNCGDVRDVSDSSFTISSQSLTNPNCPAGFICPSSTPSPSPTITPTITPASLMVSINSPRQGDTWSIGETKTISWNYNNLDSTIYGNKYVDVLLVPSDGREPVKLGTNISAPSNSLPVKIYEKTSDGRSAWLSGNYKIRVVCQTTNAARFNSCYGESASFKVISPSPSPSPTVGATVR